MENIEFEGYSVICNNSKCENYEIVIVVLAEKNNPQVICGPCGQNLNPEKLI